MYFLFSFTVASFYQTFKRQMAYRSLNAILAQSKNCPFGVNTMIQLKNMTATSHNKGI